MKKNCSVVYTYKSDKTTKQRDINFDISLSHISKIVPKGNIIIVNFGNNNSNWHKISNQFKILDCDSVYSRGLGCNLGFDSISTEYVFFLDVDMIVEEGFFDGIYLRKNVCYFPICYSIFEGKNNNVLNDNGWWRDSGYGMSIFHRDDFIKVGKFKHNTSWGGEDIDLYNKSKDLTRIREKNQFLIHQWHPDGQDFKSKFYAELPH